MKLREINAQEREIKMVGVKIASFMLSKVKKPINWPFILSSSEYGVSQVIHIIYYKNFVGSNSFECGVNINLKCEF